MKTKNIVGLDLSLDNTGLADLKVISKPKGQKDEAARTLELATLHPPDGLTDVDGRLLSMLTGILSQLKNPDLIVLEGLSYGSNMGKSQERAALHFMVRAALLESGYAWIVVAPTSLKKFVCATGAAKKELMLKEVFRRYGVDTMDNNQADAAALAFFGASYLGAWPMLAEQSTQMAKFKTPKPEKQPKKRRK